MRQGILNRYALAAKQGQFLAYQDKVLVRIP